jgi:hypothetical protein
MRNTRGEIVPAPTIPNLIFIFSCLGSVSIFRVSEQRSKQKVSGLSVCLANTLSRFLSGDL